VFQAFNLYPVERATQPPPPPPIITGNGFQFFPPTTSSSTVQISHHVTSHSEQPPMRQETNHVPSNGDQPPILSKPLEVYYVDNCEVQNFFYCVLWTVFCNMFFSVGKNASSYKKGSYVEIQEGKHSVEIFCQLERCWSSTKLFGKSRFFLLSTRFCDTMCLLPWNCQILGSRRRPFSDSPNQISKLSFYLRFVRQHPVDSLVRCVDFFVLSFLTNFRCFRILKKILFFFFRIRNGAKTTDR